jgi:hypothetical protein
MVAHGFSNGIGHGTVLHWVTETNGHDQDHHHAGGRSYRTGQTERGIKMKPLIVAAVTIALTGCATSPFGTATSGGANYTYTETAAGDCTVTINSARDIAGANLSITDGCNLNVTAESAGGADAIRVIGDLVDKIK